ncbi:MAG: histidine phosphatase family protein [Dehalococcoidia bacterium]|nr:histidine phosphatase family protein [Dehalococcoidia bacterium]MDW8120409.1 histidine phosphatase family protein [Chloroflexota bacterium]
MRLLLVRHGETPANRDGRVQGHSPEGLTPLGQHQAHSAARLLKGYAPTALYTSPLPRARQTARIIAQHLGLEPLPLPALAEMHLGEVDGLTVAQLQQRYPAFMSAWRADPARAVAPGGESLQEVQERAWHALEDLLHRHPHETVVAVSHNFTILALLTRALGLPLQGFRHFHLDLGGIVVLARGREGQWVLEAFNLRDTAAPPHEA